MTLNEAFSEHLVAGQQGQLVIKFADDVHLCKILVDNGRAVHITHGRVSPEDIVASLPGKSVEWVNFIAGYPVRKKVDFPLHEQLLSAVGQQSAAPAQPAAPVPPAAPAQPAAAPQPAAEAGPSIEAERIQAAIAGFIDQVGPLGTILAEKACSSMNCCSGEPMPVATYMAFIEMLAVEIPEEDREAFLDTYKLH